MINEFSPQKLLNAIVNSKANKAQFTKYYKWASLAKEGF